MPPSGRATIGSGRFLISAAPRNDRLGCRRGFAPGRNSRQTRRATGPFCCRKDQALGGFPAPRQLARRDRGSSRIPPRPAERLRSFGVCVCEARSRMFCAGNRSILFQRERKDEAIATTTTCIAETIHGKSSARPLWIVSF